MCWVNFILIPEGPKGGGSVKLRLLQATLIPGPVNLTDLMCGAQAAVDCCSEEPGGLQTQRELVWMPTLTLINSKTKTTP